MSTSIREPRSWEMCHLVDLAKLFFHEANLGGQWDEMGFHGYLNSLRGNGMLVPFVLVRDMEIVGCIVGCLSKQMMSKTILLEELFWYVKPEHRRGTGGIRLLDAFIKHAEEKADGVVMARLSAGQSQLHRYYGKLNFTEIETHYLKLWQSQQPSSSVPQ